MNKELIRKRFHKASKTYSSEAIIQNKIAKKLIEEIIVLGERNFDSILEIGCGTGLLSKEINRSFEFNTLNLNDICQIHLEDKSLSELVNYFEGDAENITLPNNQDLIISSSTLQWFNNLESFYSKINSLLSSNGLFAFSSFSKENFIEIKTITNQGLDYISFEENKILLEKNFEIIYSYQDIIKLYFSTPKEILVHLRNTGVNAINSPNWTKGKLIHFIEGYEKFYIKNKGYCLTYNPYYFICKKKS